MSDDSGTTVEGPWHDRINAHIKVQDGSFSVFCVPCSVGFLVRENVEVEER